MSQDLNALNGKKLKDVRLRLGLTQSEFARQIPTDRAYLSELENGRVPVQQWHLDKADKLELDRARETVAALTGPKEEPISPDWQFVLEDIAAGQEPSVLMAALNRITGDARISAGVRSLCAEVFGRRARIARPRIHGVSSKLSAAQRADEARQRALGRRAAQESSPSPKAASPTAGTTSPSRGTRARRTSRRSARGPAQA